MWKQLEALLVEKLIIYSVNHQLSTISWTEQDIQGPQALEQCDGRVTVFISLTKQYLFIPKIRIITDRLTDEYNE